MSLPANPPDALAERPSDIDAGLAPVAEALLDEARGQARRILDEATVRSSALLDDARTRHDALLEAARSEGAASARLAATRALADTRRSAREQVLGAQRRIYDQVRALAQARLGELGDAPEVSELNSRLGELAHQRLGADAVVTPDENGVGLSATRLKRRLDLSSAALLEQALAAEGPRIEALWS